MPLDLETGEVNWRKPGNNRDDSNGLVKSAQFKRLAENTEERTQKIVEMVSRLSGRPASAVDQLAVLYVLNVDSGETHSVTGDGATACPVCHQLLMACELKQVADRVIVRYVRSNRLLLELPVVTHGALWHRNQGEDELNLLRAIRKPNTKLPMLLTGSGVALHDPKQILQYLDAQFPDSQLIEMDDSKCRDAIKPLWGMLKDWWGGQLYALEPEPESEPASGLQQKPMSGPEDPDGQDDENSELGPQLLIEECIKGMDELCASLADNDKKFILGTPQPSSADCNIAPKLYQLQIVGQSKGWTVPSSNRCLHMYMNHVFEHQAFKATAPPPDALLQSWEAGLHSDLPLEQISEPEHHRKLHHNTQENSYDDGLCGCFRRPKKHRKNRGDANGKTRGGFSEFENPTSATFDVEAGKSDEVFEREN